MNATQISDLEIIQKINKDQEIYEDLINHIFIYSLNFINKEAPDMLDFIKIQQWLSEKFSVSLILYYNDLKQEHKLITKCDYRITLFIKNISFEQKNVYIFYEKNELENYKSEIDKLSLYSSFPNKVMKDIANSDIISISSLRDDPSFHSDLEKEVNNVYKKGNNKEIGLSQVLIYLFNDLV